MSLLTPLQLLGRGPRLVRVDRPVVVLRRDDDGDDGRRNVIVAGIVGRRDVGFHLPIVPSPVVGGRPLPRRHTLGREGGVFRREETGLLIERRKVCVERCIQREIYYEKSEDEAIGRPCSARCRVDTAGRGTQETHNVAEIRIWILHLDPRPVRVRVQKDGRQTSLRLVRIAPLPLLPPRAVALPLLLLLLRHHHHPRASATPSRIVVARARRRRVVDIVVAPRSLLLLLLLAIAPLVFVTHVAADDRVALVAKAIVGDAAAAAATAFVVVDASS